jgi:hypothetical protein
MSIRGQMVFWNKGPNDSINRPGHSVVQLFGVVAMPTELAEQFGRDDQLKRLVQGAYNPDLGGLMMVLGDEGGERYPDIYRATPDKMLTSPIWRV